MYLYIYNRIQQNQKTVQKTQMPSNLLLFPVQGMSPYQYRDHFKTGTQLQVIFVVYINCSY